MNWLQDLLTNPNSIAHIVALYAFVISIGVLLGKIKVFGISLGGYVRSVCRNFWHDLAALLAIPPFFLSFKISDLFYLCSASDCR